MQESSAGVRWHGIDLVRLISYFAIVTFHTSLFYFYSPTIEYAKVSTIVGVVDSICRVFAFSGFTVIFVSAFLLGASRGALRKKGRLFGVLLFGWLYLSMLMNSSYVLVWDVYTLFLVAILFMLFIDNRGLSWIRWMAALGFLITLIPFWKLQDELSWVPSQLQYILGFAPCEGREIDEWPALPWIGLVWLGYGLGRELKELRQENRLGSLVLKRRELLLWLPFLLASVPQWGAYYSIRLGQYFSCDAYRQEPYVFWSHFIWVVAAVRLSIDPRVQNYLHGKAWARQASELAISRKYWLAYAVHYLYGNFIAYVFGNFGKYIPGFYETYELAIVEFLSLTLVLQNELMTRAVLRIWQYVVKLIKPSKGSTQES